jgi:PPOX class probable F420-dependent enzyme
MADEAKLLELIGSSQEGILALVRSSGYPHLSNVLYAWDPNDRLARVSTTADRVKGRIAHRDPHAALHVPGPHFWSYAVAEGDVEPSAVATEPGDPACRELLDVHSTFYGEIEDEAGFFGQMIAARRLVLRLRVRRVYGLALEQPPGS